jgi:hypothetical protein
VLAQQLDRGYRFGGGVALVESFEDLVVDALQRADDEQAARGSHLRPHVGVLEHVLDLRRAVKGQLRLALVQRAHDRQRVAPAVEEVGVAEGDVASTHGG